MPQAPEGMRGLNSEERSLVFAAILAWNATVPEQVTSSCVNEVLGTSIFIPNSQAEFHAAAAALGEDMCAHDYADECPSDANFYYGFSCVNCWVRTAYSMVVVPVKDLDGGPGDWTVMQCTIMHETFHLLETCMRTPGREVLHSGEHWQALVDVLGCVEV